MQTAYSILLTGGAGFLGTAIISELLDASSSLFVKELRVLDLHAPESIYDTRISFIKGDVTDQEIVLESCRGVDLVIHAAAIVDWGTKSESEIMSVNYQGTLNMIEACKACKVKAPLIFMEKAIPITLDPL